MGSTGPIVGDDPLHAGAKKVFSAAMRPAAEPGKEPGFVYAVLHGSAYDMAAATAGRDSSLQVAAWSIGLVAPLGLLAGWLAFWQVTRPIRRLTLDVQALEQTHGLGQPPGESGPAQPPPKTRDEIGILRSAFEQLAKTKEGHWQRLNLQDQQRREWVANISHDLRTPLASMQGYLETILFKSDSLSETERNQFLRSALSQAQHLSRLAQELLELARLELGTVKPNLEPFSLVELAQDVLQKLALTAASRQQNLAARFGAGELMVTADIGMIERVLTNLLDNAIRHTPAGGEIQLTLRAHGRHVVVEVADRGPGIPADQRPDLYVHTTRRYTGRTGTRTSRSAGTGMGLVIVRQLLQLHGSEIALRDRPGGGAEFSFRLSTGGSES
jgi:signal transduction histidine kinase